MMETINLVYIDDNPDTTLDKYLDSEYKNSDFAINYSDIIFNPQDGYEVLLKDHKVQSANVVLIDSKLFENSNASVGKFSGEEFKIVLKKYFPFIEVIIVTQNIPEFDILTISKYSHNVDMSASQYYASIIPPVLDVAIKNISIYRKIGEKFNTNVSWDNVIQEKIINALKGTAPYDELTKTDIDTVIALFKELQENINE